MESAQKIAVLEGLLARVRRNRRGAPALDGAAPVPAAPLSLSDDGPLSRPVSAPPLSWGAEASDEPAAQRAYEQARAIPQAPLPKIAPAREHGSGLVSDDLVAQLDPFAASAPRGPSTAPPSSETRRSHAEALEDLDTLEDLDGLREGDFDLDEMDLDLDDAPPPSPSPKTPRLGGPAPGVFGRPQEPIAPESRADDLDIPDTTPPPAVSPPAVSPPVAPPRVAPPVASPVAAAAVPVAAAAAPVAAAVPAPRMAPPVPPAPTPVPPAPTPVPVLATPAPTAPTPVPVLATPAPAAPTPAPVLATPAPAAPTPAPTPAPVLATPAPAAPTPVPTAPPRARVDPLLAERATLRTLAAPTARQVTLDAEPAPAAAPSLEVVQGSAHRPERVQSERVGDFIGAVQSRSPGTFGGMLDATLKLRL